MYGIPVAATLAFVLAATFSPGPNNVMSGSLGIMYGFRRTVPFLLGITCGFAIMLLSCAAASTVLLKTVPAVEPVLRWVGAAYLTWLAWSTWAKRGMFDPAAAAGEIPRAHGFVGGIVLQSVNVKGLIYGVVVYTTFLAGLAGRAAALVMSALILALVALAATSTWAVGGIAIRRWLKNPRDRAAVAAVLALTLVYTAFELVAPVFRG
jgi:cysteine/O-acetylserine efflux protein